MRSFTIQIDDANALHIINEDNELVENEEEVLEFLWAKIEFNKIGRAVMNEADLASDPKVITNIGTIISNYFAEKEQLLEDNKQTILRLALADTEEDIENGRQS